ncbi:MAG: GNAT family N-acetyltransferase [Dehalococcoidia bacterium]
MRIATERLLLREFSSDDWLTVLAYQVDPRCLRYYAWEERTPEAVQGFVQMQTDLQYQQPPTKFQFAITLPATGELIGNCGIRKASVDALEADIGYELAPEWWGNGYATEAARSMLEFGFTEPRLHRIWARCIAENVGSAHVLEKIGMQLDGRQRDKVHFKGRWWDNLLFAILEDDWHAQGTAAR